MKAILPALIVASNFLYAQISSREYFTDWGAFSTKDSSQYYTEWIGTDTTSQCSAYYTKSGRLKFVERYRKGARLGKTIYYHENGNVEREVLYYNDHPVGLTKTFYANGQLQSEELYDSAEAVNTFNENKLNYRVINFYDSSGSQLTRNGNGMAYEFEKVKGGTRTSRGKIVDGLRDSIWISHFPSGQLYYSEKWNAGTLLEGTSTWIDGSEYKYNVIEKRAEPINGMTSFYGYIGRAMKYPKLARRLGIEGRVFLEFIIDRDGTVSSVKVIRGIGGGCDEEAVRVISSGSRWNPGLQRGRPVRSKFRLAIIFKLS